MLNVTKLSVWPELQKIGFVPIKYFGQGHCLIAIGAALQSHCKDIQGRDIAIDVIEIEPSYKDFYDHSNYHITGNWKSPKRYEIKETNGWIITDFCNDHYSAKEILSIVSELKKTLTHENIQQR